MVAFLDELNGDADLEPSLGAPEYHPGRYSSEFAGSQELWAQGNAQELEDEHDGREPPEDDESTLAGPSMGVAFTRQ